MVAQQTLILSVGVRVPVLQLYMFRETQAILCMLYDQKIDTIINLVDFGRRLVDE